MKNANQSTGTNHLNGKKEINLKVNECAGLMQFLMAQMPHKSRTNIKSLLRNKQVVVDGQVVSQFDYQLQPGQSVEIRWTRIPPEKSFLQYTIVYEDHEIIVVEKQAGLLSVATDNEKRATLYSMLSDHVKKQDPSNKIFIVHRLDRETSGLMIFAKTEPIKHYLQETWNDTVIERTYIALVEGVLEKKEGIIRSYLSEDSQFKVHSSPHPGRGLEAITHYKVLKENRQYSLLKVNLETGRKNQIRVHMQEIGHPVVGDKKYGARSSPIKRLGLHARQLSFIHPSTKKKMEFESNIPKSFLRAF
jgi:23S rRNA pseudouridine1911/1915/1917 synthase